jgi:hypothetical protein
MTKRFRAALSAWDVLLGHQPRPAKVNRLMAFFVSKIPAFKPRQVDFVLFLLTHALFLHNPIFSP